MMKNRGQRKTRSPNTQFTGTSDLGVQLVHGLLSQRDGTWIRMGDHAQNTEAAVGCFIEKLLLAKKFRGVHQSAPQWAW